MDRSGWSWSSSVSLKLVFVALLILVLLVPMAMVESLIEERERTADGARLDIMQAFGRRQIVTGPLLVVPYRFPRSDKEGTTHWHRSRVFVSPEALAIRGTLEPQYRYRGLHRLAVYTGMFAFEGVFRPGDLESLLPAGAVALPGEAVVAVAVSDARTIQDRPLLDIDPAPVAFEPGGVLIEDFPSFLTARLAPDALERDALPFRMRLALAGSDRLGFVPIGHTTDVALDSPWSSPSFDGAYLPVTHTIDDDGFRARWTVQNLGRGFPARWRAGQVRADTLHEAAFGVRLYEPAGVYQQSTRAAKYALLFIGLTFLVYFLMEVFAARSLHPFQYLMVGFANCMFYLLLVSLSEHLSFALSYVFAATACSALVAGYSICVLGSHARAAIVLAVMSTLYAFLYGVLCAEDHALLLGSLALFAALAVLMYTTRRVDWSAIRLGGVASRAVSVTGA